MNYTEIKVINASEFVPDDIYDDVADYFEVRDGSYHKLYYDSTNRPEYILALREKLIAEIPRKDPHDKYEFVLLYFSW